jgi:hypothetical protein
MGNATGVQARKEKQLQKAAADISNYDHINNSNNNNNAGTQHATRFIMSAPLLPKRAEQTANSQNQLRNGVNNDHESNPFETNEPIQMDRAASSGVAKNPRSNHRSTNNDSAGLVDDYEAEDSGAKAQLTASLSMPPFHPIQTKYYSNPKYDHIRLMRYKSGTKLSLRSNKSGHDDSDHYDMTRGLFRFSLGKIHVHVSRLAREKYSCSV